MMNPYAAPQSAEPSSATQWHVPNGDEGIVTPEIVEAMAQTRPWVSFFGVLGLICCGLGLLSTLWNLAAFGNVVMGVQIGFALISLALMVLYLVPCTLLLRYGGAIKLLQQGHGVDALTDALRHQKAFWRYVGWMSIVLLVVYAIAAAVMFSAMGL